jgi:hypothetical protein
MGFPGIGLQGWAGQKVNLHNMFNAINYSNSIIYTT